MRNNITGPGSIGPIDYHQHYFNCEGYRKLVDEGEVSYEWFVCSCSPCERDWQIKKNDIWISTNICPYCKINLDEGYFGKPKVMFKTIQVESLDEIESRVSKLEDIVYKYFKKEEK